MKIHRLRDMIKRAEGKGKRGYACTLNKGSLKVRGEKISYREELCVFELDKGCAAGIVRLYSLRGTGIEDGMVVYSDKDFKEISNAEAPLTGVMTKEEIDEFMKEYRSAKKKWDDLLRRQAAHLQEMDMLYR